MKKAITSSKAQNDQILDGQAAWDSILGFHIIPLKAGISIGSSTAVPPVDGIQGSRPRNGSPSGVPEGGAVASGNMRFLSAKELAEMTPENPDWIWEGFFTVGGITMINGKIKAAGKTTLVTHACRSVLDGRSFLGYPTKKTGVMYLTEQTNESFRESLRRANLLDREDFVVSPWNSTKGMKWHDVVDMAVEEAKKRGLGLLVVDTLSRFANLEGDSENNAGDALKAMKPLKYAAGEGLGVVIIGHERKSGGDVGDAGRGSSAFGGEADIIVSIKRPEGNTRPNIREMHSLGRFDQTPEKLVVELTDKGYRALGNDAAVAEEEAKEAILRVLPYTENEAITLDDLVGEVKGDGVKRTVAQNAINEMLDKVVCRIGKGVKKDPYRYYQTGDASIESSDQDNLVSNPTDPEASTVLDEDGSLDKDDRKATDEVVRNMLDTLMPDQDVRRVRLLEAVREYIELPSKPFTLLKGVKEMKRDICGTRYLKEPLDFDPTLEEVKEAYDKYREEKEEELYPWLFTVETSEDKS